MITPQTYDLEMYENVDFDFSFRFMEDGVAQDSSLWEITMLIADRNGAAARFTLSTEGVDPAITVDAGNDYLVTARIPAADTNIGRSSLVYQIDVERPDGRKDRYLTGSIAVTRDIPV